MNVVIYTRVSTEEQAEKGNSLVYQDKILRHYCSLQKYNILNCYVEDHSAKFFDRPKWNELNKYVRKNKKIVNLVLILRWDRFARNQREALQVIYELDNLGIGVNAVEQPIDMNIPENLLLLSVYLAIPEIENRKNSIRTTEGSRTARLAGCWTGSAPIGYSNHRNCEGKSTLIKNDKASLVLDAFNEVAKNQKSADSVRKDMLKKGLKLGKQSFLNMLRNLVYIGRINVKAWKKEDATIATGLHEAIVTEDLFNMVKQVLCGKKNTKQKSHKEDENFPLRGSLICPECHGALTGGASKGRNRYYNYYKCQNNCIPNIRAEEANDKFVKFLTNIKISPEVSDLYQAVIADVFKRNEGDRKTKVAELAKKLDQVNLGVERANESFFIKVSISDANYQNAMHQFDKMRADINEEILNLETGDDNFMRYSKFAFPFLQNLDGYYQNSTFTVKKFIVGSIFPEKLYYSENNYRTTKMNEVLALIGRTDMVSEKIGNKKATDYRGLSTEAPPSGLEPDPLINSQN